MDVGEYIRRKQRERENASSDERVEMTAEEAIGKYGSMSEEQLLQELFRVGTVSGGNVTASEYDDFYRRVQPFLTPEQSAKMKSLIMQLKSQ